MQSCFDRRTHGSTWWLCLRNSAANAYYANNTGNVDNTNFYNSQRCAPLSNHVQKDTEMTLEDAYEAYMACRSSKRRSHDSVMYEVHCERNLMRLVRAVNNRDLTPSFFCFIVRKPRPREVFASDYDTRIAHHHIDMRLRPLLERRMTDRSFNNRIGMGTDAAVNRFMEDICEVTEGFSREAWVIEADLKGYFPNASQDIVYSQLSEAVLEDYAGDDRDELLYLLMRCVFAYPAGRCVRLSPLHEWQDYPADKSVFRKPDGTGAMIGGLLWQNALNYMLDGFDHLMTDTYGFHYVRFVDDMRWVVRDKDAFLPMMHEFRERLGELRCTVHPRKFSCQRATACLGFLGRHLHCGRIHVSRRIVRNAVAAVRRLRPCPGRVGTFLSTVNSYLGMMKTAGDGYAVERVLEAVPQGWYRYVRYDSGRMCFNALPGCTHAELLARRYKISINKLKRKRHDDNRENQRNRTAAA